MTPHRFHRIEAPKAVRRYRTNPIEVAILAGVVLIFGRSAWEFSQNPTVTWNSAIQQFAVREPASVVGARAAQGAIIGVQTLDVDCTAKDTPTEVQASKIRVRGELCLSQTEGFGVLTQATVRNLTTQVTGNVFADAAHGKFATDYITLVPGTNELQFEFSDPVGKRVQKNVRVLKN